MSLKSLVVAVISPDRGVHQQITFGLEETPGVGNLCRLTEYPGATQLAQIGEASAGCIIFLDFSDPIRAKAVAAEIDRRPLCVASLISFSAADTVNRTGSSRMLSI